MSEIEKYHEQAAGQEAGNWQSPPDPDGEPGSNIMAGVLRRWYIVVLVFVLLCGLGLPGIWMLLKPSYEVTGALRVDPIRENILSGQTDTGEISDYERFMNTEAEKITSSTMAGTSIR